MEPVSIFAKTFLGTWAQNCKRFLPAKISAVKYFSNNVFKYDLLFDLEEIEKTRVF